MASLLGIDIGTSGAKAVLIKPSGEVLAAALREYGIDAPRPSYAEQDPEVWWDATKANIRDVLDKAGVKPADLLGVGFSGQMHGTVLLDRHQHVIRPAIVWADQRSASQCQDIYDRLGHDKLANITANPVAPGFMAATLSWVRDHEPETFASLSKAVLPKDYVRFRLCGHVGTDVSDAAGTLLFDTANRQWSGEMIECLGLSPDLLPSLHASWEVVGTVTPAAASEAGLAEGTPVVAGGGDQPVAALGNGVVDEGAVLSTIGTGGQLFTPTAAFVWDPRLRTHTFCHVVPDCWFVMGAMLSAGLSLRWFRDNFATRTGYDELAAEASQVPAGAEGVIFLPYLLGERTPHMDPSARGMFIGLALQHTRGHLVRAIMEGVVLALRDGLEIFKSLGLPIRRIVASGGGANSPLWRQIQADVFGQEVVTTNVQEQAGVGAAMLAGIGTGVYQSAQEACRQIVTYSDPVQPAPDRCAQYDRLYNTFKRLYPKLREDFKETGQPSR